MDADLVLTEEKNPEIGQRWLPLSIMMNYQPGFIKAKKFVAEYGRMKYILPVYQALVRSGNINSAVQWYNDNILFYHPIASTQIKRILGTTITPSEK